MIAEQWVEEVGFWWRIKQGNQNGAGPNQKWYLMRYCEVGAHPGQLIISIPDYWEEIFTCPTKEEADQQFLLFCKEHNLEVTLL